MAECRLWFIIVVMEWQHPKAFISYKRIYDLLLVVTFAVVLAPIWIPAWIIIPLLILIFDGRPIFVVQTRLGLNGKTFRMIKFRTMSKHTEVNSGPVPSQGALDPRSSKFGKLLRMTSLDEAPQVVNILKGEMSIVGPRPERPEIVDRIKQEVPDYDLRLRTLPGIAGLDHIRGDFSYRKRLRYDNFYIERMNPWFDLVLIVWSVWTIVKRLKPSNRRK